MKHHKLFHAALLVSIQERREQYPEMTDADTVKALHIGAGRIQANATRQRTRERAKEDAEWWRAFQARRPETPSQSNRPSAADVEQARAAQERVTRAQGERRAREQEREAQRELSHLIAFDPIELEGEDLRRSPIEQRKAKLAKLVRGPHPCIAFNAHYIVDGEIVFEHACKLGCEGIVSKRLGSLYRSGRSKHWLKTKNPAAPAVKRGAEENWA